MDKPLGILNQPDVTCANVSASRITSKSIKEMMVALQGAMDSIPKPEHDCFVFTREVWDRVKAEFPIMSSESPFGRFDGLPFWVEPDEATAKARALLLRDSLGKKPMVIL
jgi:hypothetical protein